MQPQIQSDRAHSMVARLVLSGRMLSPAYQEAKGVVARLQQPGREPISIETDDVLDLDWPVALDQAQQMYGVQGAGPCPDLIAFHTTTGFVAGDLSALREWVATQFQLGPAPPHIDYDIIAREAFRSFCRSRSKDSAFVFMTFERDGAALGTIVFELFLSLAPKASDNFRLLCTGQSSVPGASYLHSPIHRIVQGAWIQGGDVTSGNGDETQSTFGTLFEDESFTIRHDRAGILSMANEGAPHTNGSQFFVTLRDLPFLDGRKVAFGRIVDGFGVLHAISASVTCNERPLPAIIVSDCGVYPIE